jgi:hypothetical protein
MFVWSKRKLLRAREMAFRVISLRYLCVLLVILTRMNISESCVEHQIGQLTATMLESLKQKLALCDDLQLNIVRLPLISLSNNLTA